MSTKRKAPAPTGAAGKRKAAEDAPDTIEGGEDVLGILDAIDDDDGNEGDEAALQSALENGDDGLGDELGDELEGELEGENTFDGSELGEGEEEDELSEVEDGQSEVADEDVQLPVEESELQTASEVDFSSMGISAAQARKMAPLLCANTELTIIKCEGHELTVSDLREEDELEWDSEEYHDVEAIFIAEYLKTNKVMVRLDLARNSIADAGAAALALALHENSTLEYLNLEGNSLAEKGCKALCEAVASNSTLSYLNVMYNGIPSSGQQDLRDVWTKAHGGSQLGLHL